MQRDEADKTEISGAPMAERPRDWPENVTALAAAQSGNVLRMVEALLFAASEPLDEETLAARLPEGADVERLLQEITAAYAGRGVNLVRVAGKWAFRTADDLSFLMHKEAVEERPLSRAALETLAIIAYHQPVTRSEIEEIRGVGMSKGTLDALMAAGWVRMRGRRRSPGRPITYGTTQGFLEHFGLDQVGDLPGLDELKAAGLLSSRIPSGFAVPIPSGEDGLAEDEDPLEGAAEEFESLSDEAPDEAPDEASGDAGTEAGGQALSARPGGPTGS